jgi:methylated-DNA-[protein]-cysteine S-methyltransferase
MLDVPLAPEGTDIQKTVWMALRDIPYGQTTSYAEIANQIDNPKAVRAVGAANGSNPLSIFVPCHRVIGKNGALTGYAGGLGSKSTLLALERGEQELF